MRRQPSQRDVDASTTPSRKVWNSLHGASARSLGKCLSEHNVTDQNGRADEYRDQRRPAYRCKPGVHVSVDDKSVEVERGQMLLLTEEDGDRVTEYGAKPT
jgi:hypothetical protein